VGDGKAVVNDLRVGADDEAVLAALMIADKAGMDAPFGWPEAFAAFLAAFPGRAPGRQCARPAWPDRSAVA
jgi:hypothetical protein